MSQLTVADLALSLGGQPILKDINFQLQHGEVGSLLGPSGCGKTTLLRAIAGFERPDSGSITLGDSLISSHDKMLAPEKRRIGMVFQDLALFPHLTVEGNVRFAIKHLSDQQQRARVAELLELVVLGNAANKYPHELSGGQQQRIALIRAMASRPDILLLDEPFSGQDIELREQLARDVGAIIRHDGITALLVTHDQVEAFAFSDVIGVINQGHLHQWGSAYDLYHEPLDRFVAGFIGQGVFLTGEVVEKDVLHTDLGIIKGDMARSYQPGTAVEILVRPDDIIHDDHSEKLAHVEDRIFRGADHLYTLKLENDVRVLCLASSHHNHHIGERIGIRLELDHVVAFPR